MSEKEKRFSKYVLENISDMVLLFNADGMVTYGNKAAKEKLEYGEAVTTISIKEIFANSFWNDEDAQKEVLYFDDTEHELMAYRQNKTCFPVLARFTILEEEYYICILHDVTRQNFLKKKIRQVEKDAKQALNVKSEFVANVTHELRTPVNGILGNTRELIARVEDAECQRILDLMERACVDMNAIINNVLDFSKLEAGRFVLEKREFDFRNMIDYVKANHMHKITEKGLEFFVTIAPEVPNFVIGDELRIVQIFNNLISNACKFTSVGKISVEIVKTAQTMDKAEIFVLVKDTGIGIAKEDLDKLFKSFSQVDASISRKYGGTGLGLNISKQLVEMMHGSIGVESEPNKGTMFSFSIWVEIPKKEQKEEIMRIDRNLFLTEAEKRESELERDLYTFGTKTNQKELEKNMSKLILCIEMENWEKAEGFMTGIKQLTTEAPAEIKTKVFRLKMAVQKADYQKTMTAYGMLQMALS